MPGSAACDLLLVRPHVLPEVVQVADAGVRDVERAVGDARILERRVSRSNSSALIFTGACAARALTIDSSLVGLYVLMACVDATHFRQHGFDRRVALVRVVGPQLDDDARAHDSVFDALEPFGVRRRRARAATDQSNAGRDASCRDGRRRCRPTGQQERAARLPEPPCDLSDAMNAIRT